MILVSADYDQRARACGLTLFSTLNNPPGLEISWVWQHEVSQDLRLPHFEAL
jgi:hypothetical protein